MQKATSVNENFQFSRTKNSGVIANRSTVTGNSMDVKVQQSEKTRILKTKGDKSRFALITGDSARANPNGTIDFAGNVKALVIDAPDETIKMISSNLGDRTKRLPDYGDNDPLR